MIRHYPELVMVIDMQEGLRSYAPKGHFEKVLQNQLDFLSSCPKEVVKVILIEQFNDFGETSQRLLKELSDFDYCKSFTKEGWNAFECRGLVRELEHIGAKEIFMMGAFAGRCINQSIQGALKYNFGVISAKDVLVHHLDEQIKDSESELYFLLDHYGENARGCYQFCSSAGLEEQLSARPVSLVTNIV